MRRRRAPLLLVVLAIVGWSVVVGAPASGQAGAQVAPDAEAQFVARIEGLRRAKGLAPLTVDGLLVGLARRWAASMAAAGAISHNPGLRREIPEQWDRAGENVGVGPDVDSLFDAFVASPTHYEVLVNPVYTRVGVGVVRTANGTLYTTHLFLRPSVPAVPPRASRSRTPPTVAGRAAAVTRASTARRPVEAVEAVAAVSQRRSGSGGVPWSLVVGCLAAAALVVLALRRRRRRHRSDDPAGDGEVVVAVGDDGRIRSISPATERALGHAPGALGGVPLTDLVHADDVDATAAGGEVRLRHRDGSWRHVEFTIDDGHDPGCVVLRGTDVTERRVVEAAMRNRVEHDPVSGLLSRPTLLERLGDTIERAETVVVLAVRLDGLEVVHEAYGPAIVDCVVGAAGDRLQQELGPALLGRYGDHDFAVVATEKAPHGVDTALAETALEVLRAPFVALPDPVTVVPSVGVTVVTRRDVPAAQALHQAYVAMRAAQRLGGGRVEQFHPSLSGRAVSRLQDERFLRRALEQNELCVQYQPIVRTSTGAMTGVEALLRWQHPERGAVPAAEFIGVADEAGFIGELSWWALRTACRDAARWSAVAPTFRVSVNVSPRQLAQPAFGDLVFAALAGAEAPASSLCLELTEASLLDDMSTGAERLQTVRDRGVTVAVDDFGTGYSSLGYLQQLPIDTVKIDRSFVADLGRTAAGDTIASAVVGLAHGLGLTTVAEGVETEDQAGALATLGCDHLQGYLCSPARPAEEIDALFGTPLLTGTIDLRGTDAVSETASPRSAPATD